MSDTQLSANFTLREMAVSAEFPHLVEPVPEALIPKARRLAVEVLQPIRDDIQRPMRILSAYRSRKLNDAVKGSVTTQHVRMEAADWTADDIRSAAISVLHMVADNRLPGAGQLIYYPEDAFMHVALPSARYPRPTLCVHWPARRLRYLVISPTLAAFNAAVPANDDPNTRFTLP